MDNQKIADFNEQTSIVTHQFEHTIKENINYFYELLELIYAWNPDIKVYLLLMPIYEATRQKCEKAYQPWKEFFYKTINAANQKYPFIFLDLKEHEIAKERECFQDATHLNYYGAARFSKWLSQYIDSEKNK